MSFQPGFFHSRIFPFFIRLYLKCWGFPIANLHQVEAATAANLRQPLDAPDSSSAGPAQPCPHISYHCRAHNDA
eukprot:2817768-Amphidinium_carterae.1